MRRALSSVPSPSRIVHSLREIAMIGDFLDGLGRESRRNWSLDCVSRWNSMCCQVE